MKLFLFSIMIMALTQRLHATCPQYWYTFRDKCFYHNNTAASVLSNFELCRSLNATLVSIHNKAENEYLNSILDSTKEYWLGGIQVANTLKAFTWTDGTAFNYSNWHSDQPNEESDFFCVAIVFEKGLWYDRSCIEPRRQLCQKSGNMQMKAFFQKYPQNYIHGLTENQKLLTDRLKTIETQFDVTKTQTSSQSKDDELRAWNSGIRSRFDGLLRLINDSEQAQLSERVNQIEYQITTINASINNSETKHGLMDNVILAVSAGSLILSIIACFLAFCSSRKQRYQRVVTERHDYCRDSIRNANIYDDIQLK